MCVSTCTTTTTNVGFSLTGALGDPAAVGTIAATPTTDPFASTCTYDFLAIAGGFDPITGLFNDRYCGGALKSTSVCSMFDLLSI